MSTDFISTLEGVDRLSRDVAEASRTLGHDEARFLVDTYYQIQGYRIRAKNQTKALEKLGEPNAVLLWMFEQFKTMENQIKRALAKYADAHGAGVWSQTIVGIGPVLSAGLLAHIDISRAPTVGHIWSFAGLNPDQKWEKGKKRPHNANLKTLCWKIGESFVKVSHHEDDIYGKIYHQRKALEEARNEAGEFKEQALAIVKRTPGHAQAKTYKEGKLPAGHLHSRAKRYAVKLFLSHWHHVRYELENGGPPPKPYILTRDDHVHFIGPPNWPME